MTAMAPPVVKGSTTTGGGGAVKGATVTWMALPALIMFTIFGVIPLLGVLVLSFTSWNVSTQISGRPTINMKPFCQPVREAVQIASGSFSNSTARIVAPIGPMPKNVTPMPCGKQTTC